MPYPAPRSLKIGTIIDKTLGVLEHSAVPALLFVVAIGAINFAVTYFSLSMTSITDRVVFWVGSYAAGVVAAYLLIGAMLRRTGIRSSTDGDVFLPYCLLSILSTLGVVAGMIALVIPGLVIMARWSIAPAILFVRQGSAVKALGESWERTRGAEFQILVAALALLVPLIAVMIACSFLFDPADPVGIAVSQIAGSGLSLVLSGMGVAIYGMLEGGGVESPAG